MALRLLPSITLCLAALTTCLAGGCSDAQVEEKAPLAFRIAVDPAMEGVDEYVAALDESGPDAADDAECLWLPVNSLDNYVYDPDDLSVIEQLLEDTQGEDADERAEAVEAIAQYFASSRDLVARPHGGDIYLLLHNSAGLAMTGDDDWKIQRAEEIAGPLGDPAISITLDGAGAELMSAMTQDTVGRPLAIVFDGEILTAPMINEPLRSGIQFSGDFSAQERAEMLAALRGER